MLTLLIKESLAPPDDSVMKCRRKCPLGTVNAERECLLLPRLNAQTKFGASKLASLFTDWTMAQLLWALVRA